MLLNGVVDSYRCLLPTLVPIIWKPYRKHRQVMIQGDQGWTLPAIKIGQGDFISVACVFFVTFGQLGKYDVTW